MEESCNSATKHQQASPQQVKLQDGGQESNIQVEISSQWIGQTTRKTFFLFKLLAALSSWITYIYYLANNLIHLLDYFLQDFVLRGECVPEIL